MHPMATSSPFFVVDEWSPVVEVLVGIGVGMGPAPTLDQTYDPKSREHVLAGTYPTEDNVRKELTAFREKLKQLGVNVLTPSPLGTNQVFTRDIGFVIGERFVKTSMVADRADEQLALTDILADVHPDWILEAPEGVRIEGGDVMPMGSEIWVGYSAGDDFERFTTARTNEEALVWLQENFPKWKVRGFQLNKSDDDPRKNALHLDCALSVLGGGHAIVHPAGFKRAADVEWLFERFDAAHRIEVDAEEMYHMNCNLFSVTPSTVITGRGFDRVNAQLRAWGYDVHEVAFAETAKMEGLLRCATLPLRRS